MTGAPALVVDVIVVAHNAGDLLLACLESAVREVPAGHVVVVDAASTDGAVERAFAAVPGIRTRPVPNDGFAASNNAGIAISDGAYVLLLNPDAELRPGAVSALVACAEAHPRAAIIGGTVLNPDETRQANQRGRFPSLWVAAGLRLWRAWQRLSGNGACSPRALSGVASVDWVTGACMLVRRAAIIEAGPMDPGYFLYYEDTEWCHRMRDHGWKVLVEPRAEIVHHLGSAGAPSAFVQQAYRESFYRYCDQYHLWGLRLFAQGGLAVRAAAGGRS